MKKEFNINDIAYLSNGKRMRGYTLPSESTVTIVKSKKISDKHGAYSYSVEAINPKNGIEEIYDDWFTQFDFLTKSMAEKMLKQEREIEELNRKLEDQNK